MKTFVQDSYSVELVVEGTAVKAGEVRGFGAALDGVSATDSGGVFGVAMSSGEVGDVVSFHLRGFHDLPLLAGYTPTTGDLAYVDASTGAITDDPDLDAQNPQVAQNLGPIGTVFANARKTTDSGIGTFVLLNVH